MDDNKDLQKKSNENEPNFVEKYDSIDKNEVPSKSKAFRTFRGKITKDDEPEDDKDFTKVGLIKLIAFYFKKKMGYGILILILFSVAAFATAFGPYIINNLTKVITWHDSEHLKDIPYDQLGSAFKPVWDISWGAYAGIQIGLFVVNAISTFIATLVAGYLGKYVEVDLRDRAIGKLITQDMSYYSDKKIGDLLTKVVSDTQIIGDQSQAIPSAFISAVGTTIFSLIMGFVVDWRLSLVVIIMFAIMLIFMGVMFSIQRKSIFKARDVITNVNGREINRISTIQLIKTSGTEEQEKIGFKKDHVEYEKAYTKFVSSQSIMLAVLIIGITSVQVVVSIAAGIMYKNDLTKLANNLPSFLLFAGVMVGPIMQILRVTAGIAMASSSAERIAVILFAPNRMNVHLKKNEGIYIEKIKGDIKFDNVIFAYPEKPTKVILPKTNFVFKEGKKYAFVGETGAGKSTISRLLLRFYDPTYGEVLINNDINLKDVHLSSYLEHVGYVEQEPSIILGTVFENVRYGTSGKTDEEVIEACKKADLDKVIMSWPNGYETVLGERGFIMSGGQKQRLVIARMFLKDPELLILDEATSALDNIVEKEIQAKLNVLMEGRTTVSIAHRLSTIKNADQIIVLSPGEGITQVGTFNELKIQPGHFKELYEAGLMK